MRVERWQRLAALFDTVVELPPEERAARLRAATAGDFELLRQVRRLLAADADTCDLLDRPLCDLERLLPPELGESRCGRAGPYRLLRPLGEGGMGTVYLALRDDDAFERRLAVKQIRRGLEGPAAERRFRHERQILARLEHPHIARLYDGGCDAAGRPYLAMELVEGEAITAWCDRRRLAVDERLGLFLRVCDAVAYAHRQGIVHRDLKPSNVLVTAAGEPKLLDFGVARLLGRPGADDETATRPGEAPLTPRYASPEQLRGGVATPASDVYSLGVLLYELLTGALPYRGRSTGRGGVGVHGEGAPAPSRALVGRGDEVQRRALARGRRPRALARRLSGDLDAVVGRALRPEAGRRYADAAALAADLERHRAGRPVVARRGGWRYRLGRLAARRRDRLLGAATLLAVVAASAAAVGRQLEATAGERRQRQQLGTDLARLVGEPSSPPSPSAPPSRLSPRRLLDDSLEQVALELEGDPSSRAAVLDVLGRVYHQAGFPGEARWLLERSLALRREASQPDRRDLSISLFDLGALAADQGETERAEQLLGEALELRLALFGSDHPAVAEVQEVLALMRWRQGDLVAAEELLRPALAVRRRHCGSDNQRTVSTLGDLAELLRRRGRLGEAAALFDEAVGGRQAVFAATPPDRGLELTQQADLALARDDLDNAEALYRQALAERRRSFGDSSLPVAWSLARLGRCHGEQGDWNEAAEELTGALELLRQLGENGADQVTVLNNLAVVLSYRGELLAAEALLRQVLAQRRELLGDDHPHTSQARYSLANVLAEQGRGEEAEELLRRAAAELAGRLPPGHPAAAYVEVALARQELARGEPAAAQLRLEAALGTLRAAHPPGHWRIAAAEAVLGGCLAALGEERRGAALLRAAHRALVERRGAAAPSSRWARRQLQALDVPLAG